ncbi:Alpha/Beta hydrolase protein [Mycena floridula]|nr:Alpha/Beta hydrolase protein [Mycena floridula]
MITTTKTIHVNGVDVFYRSEAGPENAPVILLLHGFPSSSHQYHNLIPKLSVSYHVVAPDFPGFGFPEVTNGYHYSLDSSVKTIQAFTEALKLERFAIYIFDYGTPIGFQLAMAKPKAITAIITQNGNAFEEGFSEFWDILRPYWADPTPGNRQPIAFVTTFDAVKSQYCAVFRGEAHPESIAPEAYHLDHALIDGPGNAEIQLLKDGPMDLCLFSLLYILSYLPHSVFHRFFHVHLCPTEVCAISFYLSFIILAYL